MLLILGAFLGFFLLLAWLALCDWCSRHLWKHAAGMIVTALCVAGALLLVILQQGR